MNHKVIVPGIAMILLGMALPTNAYHGPSTEWTNSVPFLIICESDGPNDPVNPLPVAKKGDGGLCYAGLRGASVPTSAPAATDVTATVLTVMGGATDIAYTVSVGSWTCSTAVGGTAFVNELYAYWESDQGHVALYNNDPAAPGGSSTSTAGATRASGSLCDGDPATASGPVTL